MPENVKIKLIRTVSVGTLLKQPIPKGKQFSEILPLYSNQFGKRPDGGVIQHLNIEELKNYINNYGTGKGKSDNGFLKGIYKGGTTGDFCTLTSDFLFYDIDIKDSNENKELFRDQFLRSRLIDELRKYSVLLGRSNSGIGIFGVLHIKDLHKIKDNIDHKVTAEHVYRYIAGKLKEQGITVTFDDAQGKFRQVRFIAHQKEKIEVNENIFTITYELKKEEQELAAGLPDYQFTRNYTAVGSAREKFNNDNPIESLLPQAGLTLVSGTRYKYELSESSTSGEIKEGRYINNSTTFSGQTYFDSFAMYARIKNLTTVEMYNELYKLGYKDDELDYDKIKAEVKTRLSNEEIFIICSRLKYKSMKAKQEFLKNADIPADQLDIYKTYLGMKKLRVFYDQTIKINKWVSEAASEIFDLADSKKKVIVVSETGTGKSQAILRMFKELRPDKRLIFIAPLTAIVDQLADGEDLDVVGLKGGVPESAFLAASKAKIVVATHEQATKLLEYKSNFNYIVKDEIHSDIAGSRFKNKVISKLNFFINKKGLPVIGLTGTPLNVFREKGLDFYLIKIDSSKPANKVIQRTDNRSALKIILQHQGEIPTGVKSFYRANSKDSIKTVKKELVKQGYSSDEILILDATRENKGSEAFHILVQENIFREDIKIVLTTSVIDEGVSIRNNDFKHIVFIDSDYHPRPEPLKQFLNRFRNTAEDTEYYHYRRTGEEQDIRKYKDLYTEDVDALEEQVKDEDFFNYSTFKSFVSNDNFYNEDGTINFYYLGYKITQGFFSLLNNEEFNDFLEINYNIEITVDENYEPQKVEVKKPTAAETKALRSKIYYKLKDDLITIVMHNTADKSLQQEYGVDPKSDYEAIPENDKKAVLDNITYFEQLLTARLSLGRLVEEEHVDQFLRGSDGDLDSAQQINRKVTFLNNQRALEKPPKSRKDKIVQNKLSKLLKQVRELGAPPRVDEVKKFTRELGAIDNHTGSSYNITDFITANTEYMYDSKKSRYISKENNPERKLNLIEKWMLPILSQESTKQKLATQLTIPLKNIV
jgi:hypothetical protein